MIGARVRAHIECFARRPGEVDRFGRPGALLGLGQRREVDGELERAQELPAGFEGARFGGEGHAIVADRFLDPRRRRESTVEHFAPQREGAVALGDLRMARGSQRRGKQREGEAEPHRGRHAEAATPGSNELHEGEGGNDWRRAVFRKGDRHGGSGA